MEDNNFKVGDIVIIEAINSPRMIINSLLNNSCECIWFDNNKTFNCGFFVDSILTKVNSVSEKR